MRSYLCAEAAEAVDDLSHVPAFVKIDSLESAGLVHTHILAEFDEGSDVLHLRWRKEGTMELQRTVKRNSSVFVCIRSTPSKQD